MKYTITISKTANGMQEYLQIISADGFMVNVVLIGEFKLEDARKAGVKKGEARDK